MGNKKYNVLLVIAVCLLLVVVAIQAKEQPKKNGKEPEKKPEGNEKGKNPGKEHEKNPAGGKEHEKNPGKEHEKNPAGGKEDEKNPGKGHAKYQRVITYDHTNFFDGFTFAELDDPGKGYVNYVSQAEAQADGLINTDGGKVYIGVDHTKVATGRGRDSVRIQSNERFNGGVFIMSLDHMPGECGTWPAWWLSGPNWPAGGEIDIIEGTNRERQVMSTLHTTAGCDMQDVPRDSFTGGWGTDGENGPPTTNCGPPGGVVTGFFEGCSIFAAQGNYGTALNELGGGVYAVDWTPNHINLYFWTHRKTPKGIAEDPNPATWGKPYASFLLGQNCPASHFSDMQMIINTDFCGEASSSFCTGLGDCNTYVQNTPDAFTDTYWSINYLKVFIP